MNEQQTEQGETGAPANLDEWRRTEGMVCPFCGSQYIDVRQPEISDGRCTQPHTCDECEAEWDEVYLLAGLEHTHPDTLDIRRFDHDPAERAAPEMLEALEAASVYAAESVHEDADFRRRVQWLIQDAIAKAKGQPTDIEPDNPDDPAGPWHPA